MPGTDTASLSAREKCLLDLAVLARLGPAAKEMVEKNDWTGIRNAVDDMYVDVSQNP